MSDNEDQGGRAVVNRDVTAEQVRVVLNTVGGRHEAAYMTAGYLVGLFRGTGRQVWDKLPPIDGSVGVVEAAQKVLVVAQNDVIPLAMQAVTSPKTQAAAVLTALAVGLAGRAFTTISHINLEKAIARQRGKQRGLASTAVRYTVGLPFTILGGAARLAMKPFRGKAPAAPSAKPGSNGPAA